MSGRVKVTLADGRRVTGYRKTLRKNPRRTQIERLYILNKRGVHRNKSEWQIRMGFLVPEPCSAFVSDGPHGIGVDVFKGFVHVSGSCTDHCCQKTCEFLRTIAGERSLIEFVVNILSIDRPADRYGLNLTYIDGVLVASAGRDKPRVYGYR